MIFVRSPRSRARMREEVGAASLRKLARLDATHSVRRHRRLLQRRAEVEGAPVGPADVLVASEPDRHGAGNELVDDAAEVRRSRTAPAGQGADAILLAR